MRDDDNPFLPAYDQEAWARERNYAAANLQTAFAEFVSIREQHIKELEALSPSQWERVGNHAEQGRITIINQQVHMVAHDFIHAVQIARQLGRV